MAQYDAILILGGGIKDKGEPPVWVKERLDHAIAIYKGEYIITLSAGTVHKPPPLDENGFPIIEAVAAAHYLMTHGIHPNSLLTETCSYDTIGSAYFSRVIHAIPREFRRLHIITSAFHMPRTEAIFKWMYSLANEGEEYYLTFDAVADVGISAIDLQARVAKEADGLKQFLKNTANISSLRACHQWLFAQHAAYSLSAMPTRITGRALNTY